MRKLLIKKLSFDPVKSMNEFLSRMPLEKDSSMAMLDHTIAKENKRAQ
jgi:hypothetical protein